MVVYAEDGSAATAALNWLSQLAVGRAGTAVAILIVSALGLSLLQGRLPVRRGAMAIIGCFILFSAHSIAAGLLSVGNRSPEGGGAATPVEPRLYVPPVPQPVPYDPYAGASVPTRPQDSARDLTPR